MHGYYAFGESNIDIGEDDAGVGYRIAKEHPIRSYTGPKLLIMVPKLVIYKALGPKTAYMGRIILSPTRSGNYITKSGTKKNALSERVTVVPSNPFSEFYRVWQSNVII